MRKTILLLTLLTLFSISATTVATRLVRLTIINKSGRDIEIRLTGSDSENFYYLRIPAGSRYVPTEKVFTIVPDEYSSQLTYVELWDPVYGYSCSSKSQRLDACRNLRVTVLECDRVVRTGGEPPAIIKYGVSARTHRR